MSSISNAPPLVAPQYQFTNDEIQDLLISVINYRRELMSENRKNDMRRLEDVLIKMLDN